MQKKYLKLFLPLPLIACSFAAGNLVASCANNSKITITSSSNSPVLSHKGDAVILTANVSNNYAHIITWNFDEVIQHFQRQFTYSITTSKIFNDTLRIEINRQVLAADGGEINISASNGKNSGSFSLNLSAPDEVLPSIDFDIDASTYDADDYFPDLVLLKPEGTGGLSDFIQYTNWFSDIWRTTTGNNELYLKVCLECLISSIFRDSFYSLLNGEAWLTLSNDGTNTPLLNFNCDAGGGGHHWYSPSAGVSAGAKDDSKSIHCVNFYMGAPMQWDTGNRSEKNGLQKNPVTPMLCLMPYYANTNYADRNTTNVSSFWLSVDNMIDQCSSSIVTPCSEQSQYLSFFSNIPYEELPAPTEFDIKAGTNLNVADKNTTYISDTPSLFHEKMDFENSVNWNDSGLNLWQLEEWRNNGNAELADWTMVLSNKFGGSALYSDKADQQTEIALPSPADDNVVNHVRWETRPWMFFKSVQSLESHTLQNVTYTGEFIEYREYGEMFRLNDNLKSSKPDNYLPEVDEDRFVREWQITTQN